MDPLICHRFGKESADGVELSSFIASVRASFGDDEETARANLSFLLNKKNHARYLPIHTAIFAR